MFQAKRVTTLAVVVLLLGACAPSAPSVPPAGSAPVPSVSESAEAAEPVSLRLWIPGPDYETCTQEAVADFEAANPHISIELNMMDWGNYQQQILTGVAGGTPPDVVGMFSTDVAPWADQGLLQGLSSSINRADWVESALANGDFEGETYALPWGMQIRVLFYRTDLLAEAGLTAPPASWEELRDAATRLTVRDSTGNLSRSGFFIPTNHPYKTLQTWVAFVNNNGGSFFDANGAAAFNSPEGVAATQFLTDLLNVDKVDAPGAINDESTDMVQGKVAMAPGNTRPPEVELAANPALRDKIELAPLPYQKEPWVEIAGHMVGVTKSSQHQTEAMQLLQFLTAVPDQAVKHASCTENLIPSYAPALETDYGKNDEWLQRYQPLLQYSHSLPAHPKWQEISEALNAALNEIFLNGAPVQSTLDNAAAQVNALIGG